MYTTIKAAHISFALISIGFFLLRAGWSVTGSSMLKQKWVRVLPHVNDTLLLSCAIYLMFATQQFPIADHWLTAKVVALFLYVGLGTAAIKQGKTAGKRALFALSALAVFAYIFSVALSKSPVL